ncbi:MAG: molecular chaperone HtpG [Verrucomicrobiota bacterium]|nr:molecular chaperone HtpG [Verrucomicrobiota bacterium]
MSSTEKHVFQAEIQQLLNIVIHSLYTDKEIFVRELVSNAADATEKLRFLQASGQEIYQPDLPLKIVVTANEKEGTITIADSGIGMTHAELVENLGTIAHSGSKAFLKQLAEEKKPDINLIGQFGVGFYSAFMAARRVVVETRSHQPSEKSWRWSSDGSGGYEIEPADELPRGTKITLHLNEESLDFAKEFRLEQIIKRYSNFVPFPIELNGKTLNTMQAIWGRNKNEIKEEEYDEFYKYIGHDQEKPLYRLHFNADAPLSIQSLLYVPSKNFEALGMARSESEVNLYCRKVLIQPHAKNLFPEWLRFLKGAVDSEDMPLNISRETMQDSSLMQKLNKVLTSRFLKFLDEQATKEPEKYKAFYAEYHKFIKEGVVTDFTHREALGKLLRYESSTMSKGERTSLADYVSRMPEAQKEIYYLLSPSRESAEASPYFEVFSARKFEVLFLDDPWDEFVMDNLREFEGKPLVPAERADLKLEEQKQSTLSKEELDGLISWLKETLKGKVNDVQASSRLVDSPAVVVEGNQALTASMRKILKAMRKDDPTPESVPNLEINPAHKLIVSLAGSRQSNPALATKVAEQLVDNARVAAGLVEDPRTMVRRLNELLENVLTPK